MDRLEYIRQIIDQQLAHLYNEEKRKYAYIHLYGVSQCCILLAMKRGLNYELAGIMGMLHDLATYTKNCRQKDHAYLSAKMAQEILEQSELFTQEERDIIVQAIDHHSDKMCTADSIYDELLKDGDVLQHYFYNPAMPLPDAHKVRLYYLLENLK